MHASLRSLLLTLLLLPLLTVSALADTGPKPQLLVRVKNAPEEPYYLDLVAEGPAGQEDFGLSWSYTEEELALLDQALLDRLLAAVPEGCYACTAQGGGAPMWGDLYARSAAKNGDPLHRFGYVGLPDTCQLLLVTNSGETYLSPPITRKVLQSTVTLDWADRSVRVPSPLPAAALQFFCTLSLTLLVEGLVLLAFGYSFRQNKKPFLLINLATQGGLTLWLTLSLLGQGLNPWFYLFLFIPAELIIALLEALVYRKTLTGHSKARATAYGLAANFASIVMGRYLVVPLWTALSTLI